MRIELTSNADEAADVSALWTLQSTAGKALKQRTVLSCGLSAAIAGAYVSFRGGYSFRLVIPLAIVAGAIVGSAYALVYDFILRRRIRRYMRETLGTASYPFVAELRETGLWFTLRDLESLWNWSAVREIKETARGVELWFETGIVIARTRAFATPEEQRRFAERARELAGAA